MHMAAKKSHETWQRTLCVELEFLIAQRLHVRFISLLGYLSARSVNVAPLLSYLLVFATLAFVAGPPTPSPFSPLLPFLLWHTHIAGTRVITQRSLHP